MSIRSDNESDSLWLLLDTICNAFGGMLLVALLFAVLANTERQVVEPPDLTNQVARLKTEIKDANDRYTNLVPILEGWQAFTGGWYKVNQFATNTAFLQDTVSNLTVEVSNHRWLSTNPAVAASNATAQFCDLTQQVAQATQSFAEAMIEYGHLTGALRRIDAEVKTNVPARNVHLRLPKEHPAGKEAFHVVLKFEQVFFLCDAARSKRSINTDGLAWTEGGTDRLLVTPLQDRGTPPDHEAVAAGINALNPKTSYVVCWVYADSFRAFQKVKEVIIGKDLEYGWIPMEEDQSLSVANEEVSPAPAQ